MSPEQKQALEALKVSIKEALRLTVVVDQNVMATDSSVWALCSQVEEIDALLTKFEEVL